LNNFLIVRAGNLISKIFNSKRLTEGCQKTDMLTSYQYLNSCSNTTLWSVKRYWMCQMKCSKCHPALFTHACESSAFKSIKQKLTAFATGFWGSSFNILCNVVRSSAIVHGLFFSLW